MEGSLTPNDSFDHTDIINYTWLESVLHPLLFICWGFCLPRSVCIAVLKRNILHRFLTAEIDRVKYDIIELNGPK